MTLTPLLPDVLYLRNREDLLAYEDARFASLLSVIPNCYIPPTDYTIWGSVLRAVARELGLLEYDYSYDMVSLDPQYLTPPDIRRRWASPLFINKSFPNLGQSDQEYKAMLVALIPAYREGTTLQSIEDVIAAYTNAPIKVQELYRLIGQGIYDDTYRNTLAISVEGLQVNPMTTLTSAAWLQTVSQDLYAAIDLAKPAHVGLDYTIAFVTDEDIGAVIRGITDSYEPEFDDVEPSPLEPIFTYSPNLDPDSPMTELAAWGQRVGLTFAQNLTADQWAGLPAAYRLEYQQNRDGSYSLNPACRDDVALVDQNSNLTGAISKARGVLAPRLVTSWEIKSDQLTIFEID